MTASCVELESSICKYRLFQFLTLLSKMAVAFETSDMTLSKEQAEHINYHHVQVNDPPTRFEI